MAAFSHSRLSTFETCKLQYKFAYIDRLKVEREETTPIFLGLWYTKPWKNCIVTSSMKNWSLWTKCTGLF